MNNDPKISHWNLHRLLTSQLGYTWQSNEGGVSTYTHETSGHQVTLHQPKGLFDYTASPISSNA